MVKGTGSNHISPRYKLQTQAAEKRISSKESEIKHFCPLREQTASDASILRLPKGTEINNEAIIIFLMHIALRPLNTQGLFPVSSVKSKL